MLACVIRTANSRDFHIFSQVPRELVRHAWMSRQVPNVTEPELSSRHASFAYAICPYTQYAYVLDEAAWPVYALRRTYICQLATTRF